MDILIFVTLGTQDKPFNRLLEALEYQIDLGNIKEDVIVQAGLTKYESAKMKIFNLVSHDEFEKYIKEARIVITHGGVGSIITALKHEKKVIAAPRLAQYGEHVNDHQLQILKCFEKKGYILPLYDFNDFDKVLKNIEGFSSQKYISNSASFNIFVEKLINS